MIKAKLIVVGGDAKRAEVPLKSLPVTIGRARDATITLPHTLVSRKHCEIFEANDQLFVKDLNSLNGTYLNSERITGIKSLKPGELLTLGNVTFRADYEVLTDAKNSNESSLQEPAVTEELQQDDTIDSGFAVGLANRSKVIENPTPKFRQTEEKVALPDAFDIDTDHSSPPASVCLGAIEDLPKVAPSTSFAAQINHGDKIVNVDPETVQIDLINQTDDQQTKPTESSLNDFFRKMPK